jgi:NAD(P)-dependent dehydrogenase (short-subunit alcohol dehydrogenase family)
MNHVGVVTGADRGLGRAIAASLLGRGWTVIAGRYLQDWDLLDKLQKDYPDTLKIVPMDVSDSSSMRAAAKEAALLTDHVDIIVCNAALMSPPGEKMSEGYYEHIVRTFNTNALGELRTAEFFLPLMKAGMKRLCFISTEAGSIIRMWRDGGYAYSISKTALNMGVRIMFNDLYRDGFTFRLYHPGHMMHTNPDGTYEKGADFPPEDSAAVAVPWFIHDRDDEARLVMIDYLGNEWPY